MQIAVRMFTEDHTDKDDPAPVPGALVSAGSLSPMEDFSEIAMAAGGGGAMGEDGLAGEFPSGVLGGDTMADPGLMDAMGSGEIDGVGMNGGIEDHGSLLAGEAADDL